MGETPKSPAGPSKSKKPPEGRLSGWLAAQVAALPARPQRTRVQPQYSLELGGIKGYCFIQMGGLLTGKQPEYVIPWISTTQGVRDQRWKVGLGDNSSPQIVLGVSTELGYVGKPFPKPLQLKPVWINQVLWCILIHRTNYF